MLAPGRYPVIPALTVSASNLIVTGGGGPGDTILYRASAANSDSIRGVRGGRTCIVRLSSSMTAFLLVLLLCSDSPWRSSVRTMSRVRFGYTLRVWLESVVTTNLRLRTHSQFG